MPEKIAVLILAAGKSTRMKSDLPKVLHPLGGRPVLGRVIETAKALKPSKIVCLVGHQADKVRAAFSGEKMTWALQREQLGTAHAVQCGLKALKGFRGSLLILSGDVPLLRSETLKGLRQIFEREEASLAVLTMAVADPKGYGRILRRGVGGGIGSPSDAVDAIIEEKELSGDERDIREVNAGIYLARIDDLQGPLRRVKKSIAKGEYYLTDLVSELIAEGKTVVTFEAPEAREALGINTRKELADADAELQRRTRERWMAEGVTMYHPESIRIDEASVLEADAVLHAGAVITGTSRISKGAEILPYSVIEDSVVGAGAKIGPFAHLRPGSSVAAGGHVGNFVELKKTKLGPGAKANHLAYLGDAVIGANANVGAGTITCNYDGFHKYPTVIGEGAFIGSDTQLVAPVKIGKHAWVGAGTTVTKDIPDGALAVSRVEQKNISGYDTKKRKG